MENNPTFLAEEYHQHIPLFLSKNQSGHVHSVFNNGVNIRMGEGLVFIGSTANGQLPFGIHIQKTAVRQLASSLKARSSVVWDEGQEQLCFESNQTCISLTEGRAFKSSIAQWTEKPAGYSQSFEEFLTILIGYGEPTGLDLDIERFMLSYLANEQGDHETIQPFVRLMDAVFSKDPNQAEHVLRYFLGRGRGLTPSGDDHVVGLLAVHAATGLFQPTFLSVVEKLIEREAITTDIGKEYVSYALKGNFSSPIVHVMDAFTKKNNGTDLKKQMLMLLPLGHSSGVDTAFGILIGLLAIRRNYIWEKK